MPKAVMETPIARPADEVWARIREFSDLGWYPGIESCTQEGDVRVAKVAGVDLECDELLVEHDDERRTYTYAVIGFRGDSQFDLGGGQVLDLDSMTGHHRASITIVEDRASACVVVYELELDEGHDSTFESTSGQYKAVSEHLKGLMEA